MICPAQSPTRNQEQLESALAQDQIHDMVQGVEQCLGSTTLVVDKYCDGQ